MWPFDNTPSYFYGQREKPMSKSNKKIYNIVWWILIITLGIVLFLIAILVLAAVEVSRMESSVSSALGSLPTNNDLELVVENALRAPEVSEAITQSMPIDEIIQAVIQAIRDMSNLSMHSSDLSESKNINTTYIAKHFLNKEAPTHCSSNDWCQTAPQCVIYKDVEHCEKIAEEIMCICGFSY